MAPHLTSDQHAQLEVMIRSKLPANEIADAVDCTDRTVRRIRSKLALFDSTRAPPNRVGRRSTITPLMREALCDRLAQHPDMYRQEMIAFLHQRFGVTVSASGITRALQAAGWSRKTNRRVAKQRSQDLQELYLYKLRAFQSHHLVFIDESGCDKRVGLRRSGWAPLGVAPVQVTGFHREQRYHILPAYTQDGVLLARVYQGSTDGALFEDFIEQLLHHCGRWPEPRSVLVMDNASIHHSDRVEQLCIEAGVKLLYLPPYSPTLNPIEEFFAELKTYVKGQWDAHHCVIRHDFGAFLRSCVDVVGARQASARGHFRQAGIHIDEPAA